jgi:ferritin-like protein
MEREGIPLPFHIFPPGKRNVTMASEGLHEDKKDLKPETRDMHRALSSLIEELEAVTWYNQRADACSDEELRKILRHNRDEEKEHAAMLMEWIRRQDAAFDRELHDYIFSMKSIAGTEAVKKNE